MRKASGVHRKSYQGINKAILLQAGATTCSWQQEAQAIATSCFTLRTYSQVSSVIQVLGDWLHVISSVHLLHPCFVYLHFT